MRRRHKFSPFLLREVDLSSQTRFFLAANISCWETTTPRVFLTLQQTHLLNLFCLLFAIGHRSPPARSGHRCVADNANLYVFGGYNPDYDESGGPENEDYPLFRELWRYNFATDTWHQMGTEGYMPRELASMSRTYGNSIPTRPLGKLF